MPKNYGDMEYQASTRAVLSGTGTAALPGITFAGDLNTGIYTPGADQLGFSTNGVVRLTINDEGALVIPDVTAPGVTTNKLYSVGGALTWNGTDLTAGGGGVQSRIQDTQDDTYIEVDTNGTGTLNRIEVGVNSQILTILHSAGGSPGFGLVCAYTNTGTGNRFQIQGGATYDTGSFFGGAAVIQGGIAYAGGGVPSAASGGRASVEGGIADGQGPGGVASITGGSNDYYGGGVAGTGGEARAYGGNSDYGNGGAVKIIGGQASYGDGVSAGAVNITGGYAGGTTGPNFGGAVIIKGGSTYDGNTGGNITLEPGNGGTGGTDGDIILSAGNSPTVDTVELKFIEHPNNGTNTIGLKVPVSITANRTWTLPVDDPSTSVGKFLTTDSSGVLSFADSASAAVDFTTYTAIASQTIFTGADDNANVLSYTVGFLDVYLNGVLLDGSQYTASNGTSVVLNTGAAAGDTLQTTAYTGGGGGGGALENLIINGDMRVWQRGTSFVAAVDGYSADRWLQEDVTTGVTTITKATTTVSDNQPFESHFEIDVTTVDASIAAGDYYAITTRLEGYDTAHLMYGKTSALNVTLKFRHAHTKTGIYCIAFKNSATNRSYVVEYTQGVTDTWETSTITIPGDVAGTWVIGDGIGLQVSFVCMAGTTFQTTADTWAAGNFFATSSQVNGLDSTSNFMRFGGIELVQGDNADSVNQRSYKEELERCQRYFLRVEGLNIGFGFANTTTDFRCTIPTPTTMRAAATITVVNALASLRVRGGVADSITPTAISGNGLQSNGMKVQVTVASGLNANYAYILYAPTDGVDLDSEL